MKGLWCLRCSQDLLKKLEHDLNRMRVNKRDAYAAFDFFITAYHLVEWRYPGYSNAARRLELEREQPLLTVAGAIANGGKHFETEARKWKIVSAALSFVTRLSVGGLGRVDPRGLIVMLKDPIPGFPLRTPGGHLKLLHPWPGQTPPPARRTREG